MTDSTAQLNHERKLYKRLVLTRDDLAHAESCAEALLNGPEQSKTIRQALMTAMIVSYYRPFSDNKGSVDALKTLPPKRFLSEFDGDNCATHKWIRDLRNKVMAHSDSSAYGTDVYVVEANGVKLAIPSKWNPWAELDENRIKTIRCNIGKIQEKVTDEIMRIQQGLPVEEPF